MLWRNDILGENINWSHCIIRSNSLVKIKAAIKGKAQYYDKTIRFWTEYLEYMVH